MSSCLRKVIRVRGSYLVYLPKAVFRDVSPESVEMYWGEYFVGINLVGERVAEVNGGDVVAAVVAGYAAGLDKLYIRASRDEVEKAVERVFGEVAEEEGGRYVIRYVDKYLKREEVLDRMMDALVYALEGLGGGMTTLKTIQAIDDEVDKLRLTVNRLCARRPCPRCVFYVQLARFLERAVDHVVELQRERARADVWHILAKASGDLRKAVESGGVAGLFDFLRRAPSVRFTLMQMVDRQLQALHAMRVLDYLVNSAEVYLDLAIFQSSKFKPTAKSL